VAVDSSGNWATTLTAGELDTLGEGALAVRAQFVRASDGSVSATAVANFAFDKTAPNAASVANQNAANQANAVSELAGGVIATNGQTTEAAQPVQVRVALPASVQECLRAAEQATTVAAFVEQVAHQFTLDIDDQAAAILNFVTQKTRPTTLPRRCNYLVPPLPLTNAPPPWPTSHIFIFINQNWFAISVDVPIFSIRAQIFKGKIDISDEIHDSSKTRRQGTKR
jgi:hypothetical protein